MNKLDLIAHLFTEFVNKCSPFDSLVQYTKNFISFINKHSNNSIQNYAFYLKKRNFYILQDGNIKEEFVVKKIIISTKLMNLFTYQHEINSEYLSHYPDIQFFNKLNFPFRLYACIYQSEVIGFFILDIKEIKIEESILNLLFIQFSIILQQKLITDTAIYNSQQLDALYHLLPIYEETKNFTNLLLLIRDTFINVLHFGSFLYTQIENQQYIIKENLSYNLSSQETFLYQKQKCSFSKEDKQFFSKKQDFQIITIPKNLSTHSSNEKTLFFPIYRENHLLGCFFINIYNDIFNFTQEIDCILNLLRHLEKILEIPILETYIKEEKKQLIAYPYKGLVDTIHKYISDCDSIQSSISFLCFDFSSYLLAEKKNQYRIFEKLSFFAEDLDKNLSYLGTVSLINSHTLLFIAPSISEKEKNSLQKKLNAAIIQFFSNFTNKKQEILFSIFLYPLDVDNYTDIIKKIENITNEK